MPKRPLLAAIAVTLAAPGVAAPPRDAELEAALRGHIAVLAADAYEGRKPGTAGGAKTEAYIAAQFRRAGLRPGAEDGGWLQPVALIERTAGPARVSVRPRTGAALPIAADAIALIAPGSRVALAGAPVVFAGYGVKGADRADLGDVDVRGAVLIVTARPPAGTEPVSGADRRKLFAQVGAVAMLTLVDGPVQLEPARGFVALAADPASSLIRGGITRAAADALLRAGGEDPAALLKAAQQPDFYPRRLPLTMAAEGETQVRRFTASNVIGLLPGRAAEGEAIAYTAHWDHLGYCRPVGAPDRICNGAVDNASGVAMLIETARRQATAPRADRDMLFVATTGEELGLLGAEAFAADPPRPLARIVAALNLDSDAIGAGGQPAAIIGRGITPTLDRAADAAAAAIGRAVDADTEANVMVTRQDGWALGKRGLPSVMVGGSFSDMGKLEAYLGTTYHQPDDDMAHLPPLGGAAEDVVLNAAVGQALADRERYPTPARTPR